MYDLHTLTSPILPVSHGFFTRKGGTSLSPYHGLNVSYFVGDQPHHVEQNRKQIASYLQENIDKSQQKEHILKLCFPHQIHGKRVCVIECPSTWQDTPHAHITADALVTQHPDVALGITTADCVPILLYESQQHIIGAIHAGWRGLVLGIIDETLHTMKKMGAEPCHIHAAIGPAIATSSYQVGDMLLQHLPLNAQGFIKKMGTDLYLDLISWTKAQLHQQHIPTEQICTAAHKDTYTHPDLFFSCRRAGHQQQHHTSEQTSKKKAVFGCQASIISLSLRENFAFSHTS